MNSTNISNISDSVRTAVCNREARPGDVVMLNDLAVDAGLSLPQGLPTVQDWAVAADGAICQSLTQAICRGVLNTANAVEAWKMVQQARASEDCRYIGMDLHSTNVVVSVVHNVRDRHGRLVRRKERSQRIDTRDGGVELAKVLAEYCDNNQPHIAVVESTYNIYFVADIFEIKGWNLLIADPCAVSFARLKATNDYTDAEYLADKLCSDSLHVSLLLPHEDRAIRDLVRTRMRVVQDRAREKIIFINMASNQLGHTIEVKIDALAKLVTEAGSDCPELVAIYPNRYVREKAAICLRHIHFLNQEVDRLNAVIYPNTKDIEYVKLLKSIPGCGDVIASTIATEIWDIKRFATVKDFVSYCRLAPTSRLSNGKLKGLGNAKNGNAYLSWAMTELTNLMIRFNKTAAQVYARLLKKYAKLRVKAIRSLAARIARGVYQALKKNEPFDEVLCFGFRASEAA